MTNTSPPNAATLRSQRRSLLWRIHFWAALIASPFALAAALTGILYIFTPQIEGVLYEKLDTVTPGATARPLDDAVAAAKQAAPAGWALHSVVPAYKPTDSVRVAFTPPPSAKNAGAASGGHNHGGHNHGGAPAAAPAQMDGAAKPAAFLRPNFGLPNNAVVQYVNPYTAEVLGSMVQGERFSNWSRKLHSNYLQNDNWRWMVELAASWLMVMLVTGVYLWWPQGKQGVLQAALPQSSARGRVAWKQWHAFTGVALSVMSAVILTTGLTWSKYAGDQVRLARDLTNQGSPRIPATIKSTVPATGAPLTWQAAHEALRGEAPDISMQVMAPKGPDGVWRANQMDKGQPERRFDLLLDAYTGQRLYYSGWDKQTAFGKATAIGIPFHRGEFGWWNQALLFIFGLGVIFSIVSGWVMYFKRRAKGLAAMPALVPGAWKSASPYAVLGAVVMFVAMPLLALSAALVAVVELGGWWFKRRALA
jgi:uncharacterized iron-regulated membrane protein